MTYRDPDPDRVHADDVREAANAELEDAAARGREALKRGGTAPVVEAGRQRALAAPLAAMGLTFAAIAGAAAAGLATPFVVAAGGAGLVTGAVVAGGASRLVAWRERRWLETVPFAVRGYVETLTSRAVVCAVTTTIVLAALDEDDRARVVEMLGSVPADDPVVTVDGMMVTIESLVPDQRRRLRRCLRALIDQIGRPLHATRRVVMLRFSPATAALDRRIADPYT